MAAYTTIDDPEAYFQVVTYTGNGSANHAITLPGTTDMQPDLVWIKNRDATDSHCLFDAVRGATKVIHSDSTAAESTDADTLDSFTSDGFQVDADVKVNTNTEKYVAWCWKESATAGFDMVDYDGAGAANHSHSLSAVPRFMIVKRYSATESWFVYNGSLGQAKVGYLNDIVAWGSGTNVWGGSDPTSSVFSIGSDSGISGSGDYVAYLWAEKQGFSKFGTYVGNGSTDGTFVYTGFKPAMVIMKNQAGSEDWHLYDNKRANSFNVADKTLDPNNTNAEYTISSGVDFLSNGFKWRATASALNGSGADYVYGAWAEAPFVNSNGVPCNAR